MTSDKKLSAFTSTGRRALALTMMLMAFVHVIAALVAFPWDVPTFTEPWIDLGGIAWEREGMLGAGLLLFVIARALARGKRNAWWLALGLLMISLVGAVITRSERGVILLALGVLIPLLILAPLFPTRSDTRASMRGYAVLVLSIGGIVGCVALEHFWHVGGVQAANMFRGRILLLLLSASFLSLCYGVFEVLQPVHGACHTPRDARQRVRDIVRCYGSRATVHFALGMDKSYFWSETGRTIMAYRVVRGVALALSDPIGPQEEHESLLLSFLAFCRGQDWPVAVYQASPQMAYLCQQCGLHAYKVGEEAIIEVSHFSLQGKRGAPVRHAIARAKRGDMSVQCWHKETLPEDIFTGMQRISVEWLSRHKARSQMGFSMGQFPADWSPELLTVVARGPCGEVQAFLTWTPLYAGNGWALDNMRRNSETTPGAVEWLIAQSVEWAQAHGYTRMSLGLAPLAGLGKKQAVTASSTAPHYASRSAALWERGAGFLHTRGIVLEQYRSLYAFKAKFQPVWENRYLAINERQSLPRVLLALASVHRSS